MPFNYVSPLQLRRTSTSQEPLFGNSKNRGGEQMDGEVNKHFEQGKLPTTLDLISRCLWLFS